ncbi:hypothetical protein IGI04_002068 [Brassica rapa subsp. trilocularis]|uniref:Uncharacterized protein n=1 Tax=Brassica rapa subsp. trilocularis TaxID=1813537 RepID=A0ABQ7NWK4_BRACM|nr:hypothetical protein IGI04_002068 [Brassica rapa subsp. trilocularis]
MPRQMKINIDRCTQVPSIDVEKLNMRHFGSSGLEAQVQALTKRFFCYSFTLRERERVLERRSLGISYSRIGLARTRRSMYSTDYRSTTIDRHFFVVNILTVETRDLQIGIYKYYNLQHVNSGPASNIISNQSTDTRPSSSIDPNRSTTIDITPCTSIDTVSSKMVNVIILTQDENGNLYDQDGHLRNATEYESEYETEYSESIDTHTFPSIDSNESTVTDDRNKTSLDVDQPVDHFTLSNHCYPHFAFQPPSKRGRDDYSIGSWADSGFHESFAVDTVITSPNEEHTEEYDDDYWKERAIEMSLQDERFETHKFTNTFPTSFDEVHSTSVDTHPRPAKQPLTSIDTHIGTSINICAGAKIQEQENIPSPTKHTSRKDEHSSVYINRKSMKSNHLKNTSSAEIILPSIDASVTTSIDTTLKPNLSISKLNDNANIDYGFLTPDAFGIFRDPDGNARAIDGRILQVSREDIADILQVANGPDKLFSQQRGTPDVIQTNPNKHVGVTATEINPYLSCQPKGQASIDGTTQTSIDRITPTSTDKDDQTSIDRRYEFGYRAFDMYGARKFTWERRDEYGVYRDECGHARGVAGEMIHVTKDDIMKLLERASLFEESHICLPEQATSFTLTRLAPELYTKDEINEMVTGICGAQEKLGEELKSLVEDTHQPLDRGDNELFRSMVEMRTEIESLRQQLEKEARTSASIDAPHAPSIDVSLLTAQIPAEPQCSAEHKAEWEVSYINTRINDMYYPLNNNVDWLSTKIEVLQQDLDTIRKKDQQPATSIDVCTITSLDAKISAIDDRLHTYDDMHDRFANSFSIDRLRGPWISGKNPVELLPYTAAEVDKITSKIYTAIDTMEERLDKRCDDIYFPFDNRISGLDSHAEWIQKEVKAIQRQLAAQHQISASIDKKRAKSVDGKAPRSTDEHLIASIDAESTPAGE